MSLDLEVFQTEYLSDDDESQVPGDIPAAKRGRLSAFLSVSVVEFLSTLDQQIVRWADQRTPGSSNYKPFATVPSLSLTEWCSAYAWAKDKKPMVWGPNASFYIVAAEGSLSITTAKAAEYLDSFENNQSATFEELMEMRMC